MNTVKNGNGMVKLAFVQVRGLKKSARVYVWMLCPFLPWAEWSSPGKVTPTTPTTAKFVSLANLNNPGRHFWSGFQLFV